MWKLLLQKCFLKPKMLSGKQMEKGEQELEILISSDGEIKEIEEDLMK